jgi:hypothetical protein
LEELASAEIELREAPFKGAGVTGQFAKNRDLEALFHLSRLELTERIERRVRRIQAFVS